MSDSLAIDYLPVIITRHLSSDDFWRMILAQFDQLCGEREGCARVSGISLHLFVIGGKDDMNEVSFVDTTLRDGQASLWAMGMRTGMILPVAEKMDQAGFEAIEMIGIAFVKKCVRELREDPWQRIRLAREP